MNADELAIIGELKTELEVAEANKQTLLKELEECKIKMWLMRRERKKMNARQAARAAAKRIEELEHFVRLNTQDIKDYNRVIQDMIAGESPCPYCEEWEECNLAAKAGKGCSSWWLRFREVQDDSKTVFLASSESGERTQADPGEDSSL